MTKLKSESQDRHLAVVVLAAGRSTRMGSDLPKVLHPLAGLPILCHVDANVAALNPDRTILVVAPDGEELGTAVAGSVLVVQTEPNGTADAVERSAAELDGFDGDVLIVYGDSPFLSSGTMQSMLDVRRAPDGPAVVVLGFESEVPGRYGRLVLDADGGLAEIVEAAEATPAQLTTHLCNSGMMVVDGAHLYGLLAEVRANNVNKERYLTDIVRFARDRGLGCAFVSGIEDELMGIDTRADLAIAEANIQTRLRAAAMAGGATLIDPQTVFFSFDTSIGRDVIIEPGVFFGPGVSIGDGAHIRAYSHVEGAEIGEGVSVGPFARLRPGTRLKARSRVGSFVEAKNSTLGEGAKANHLTYLGEADVGSGANIGAGTITCNYDGFAKSTTVIGKGAFVGSNTALVAPVSIGAGAVVGAGSTITKDVAENALALARARQTESPGWAEKRRTKRAPGDTD